MQTLARLAGGIIVATPFHVIDVTNPGSEGEGIRWWEELTGRGGEGMVVKPLEFIANNRRGLVQPAVKCRGREYLRIIYGPEYTAAENLERLRFRGLSRKRSLALRELKEERTVTDDLITSGETRCHLVRIADPRAEVDSSPGESVRAGGDEHEREILVVAQHRWNHAGAGWDDRVGEWSRNPMGGALPGQAGGFGPQLIVPEPQVIGNSTC
jgi:hypothetical protein